MEKTIDESNKVTPEKIFETFFAQTTTAVLITGSELDIYTHIKNGNSTAVEIAKAAQANSRCMEILLNSLVALKFLTKSKDTYQLTPLAEKFLVKDSSAYLGDYVQVADMHRENLIHLTEVVRTGKSFSNIEQEEGEEVNKILVPRIFPVTYPLAKAATKALGIGSKLKNLEVLDVGAGSGSWSISFAESDAGTKVTALDLPSVLEITKKFVDRFGLNDRISYLPGDLRIIDFGREKYDLVILGDICHNQGAETSRKLFSRIHRSLKSGGRLLISEIIPDNERSSTVIPLLFAVIMLTATAEGNTFTMKEYMEWLQEAGFRSISTIDNPGPFKQIIANK